MMQGWVFSDLLDAFLYLTKGKCGEETCEVTCDANPAAPNHLLVLSAL
jgi:hypothetical protein